MIGTGGLAIERQRTAAEIAEHERRAGPRRRGNGVDRIVDGAERACHRRKLEQNERGEDNGRKPDRGLTERHRAAVLTERPRDRQQRQHAKRRLQLQHESPKAPAAIMPAPDSRAMPCCGRAR
jgi:hypothetical protein